MSNLTTGAQELGQAIVTALREQYTDLSLFEVLQAVGSVALTVVDETVKISELSPAEQGLARAEADILAERFLAHFDAVRTERKTIPAVDMLAAAQVLVQLGVHYQSRRVERLAAQAAAALATEPTPAAGAEDIQVTGPLDVVWKTDGEGLDQ